MHRSHYHNGRRCGRHDPYILNTYVSDLHLKNCVISGGALWDLGESRGERLRERTEKIYNLAIPARRRKVTL